MRVHGPHFVAIHIIGLVILAGTIASASVASEVDAPVEVAGFQQREVVDHTRLRVDLYRDFHNRVSPGPVIPALDQDFVPQGLSVVESQGWILLSGYHDVGGPSLLFLLDAATGRLAKVIHLYEPDGRPYTGHAGGVAASSRHIWVASEGRVRFLRLNDILEDGNALHIPFQGAFAVPVRASYVTVFDGVLWVGEFAHGSSYPTDERHWMTTPSGQHHRAWMVGYRLDPVRDMPPQLDGLSDPDAPVPDMILSVTDRIQGAAFRDDTVYLSQSYGRNNDSALLVYRNPLNQVPEAFVTLGDREVPLWYLDSMKERERWRLPPMSEGIAVVDGEIFILFESGAAKYREFGKYPVDRIQIFRP